MEATAIAVADVYDRAAAAGLDAFGYCDPVQFLRRFLAKAEVADSGCWQWTACVKEHGYGWVTVAGKAGYAHRVSYKLFNGPIPRGLVLDHLCRNRACINPDHLEPVTNTVNVQRGVAPRVVLSREKRCMKGHHKPYKGHCKICRKAYRASRPTQKADPNRVRPAPLGRRYIRDCVACGTPVIASKANAQFCSRKCYLHNYYEAARTALDQTETAKRGRSGVRVTPSGEKRNEGAGNGN